MASRQSGVENFNFIHTFKVLKRTIVISLLAMFLYANTELHELLKLPVLVHHYLEHDTSSPDLSFFEFLKEHYDSNNTHRHPDNNHNDHQKLPFKNGNCSTMHSVLDVFQVGMQSCCQIDVCSVKAIFPCDDLIYLSSIYTEVFQPPQFC